MDELTRDDRWGWFRRIDPLIFDSAFAALLLLLGVLSIAYGVVDAQHPRQPDVLAYVLTVAGFGSLVLRRRQPIAVVSVAAVSATLYSWREYPENGLPIACLVALYTVATISPRRHAQLVGLAFVVIILGLSVAGAQGLDAAGAVSNLAMFGVAYAAGSYMRVRRAYTAQLELRAAELEENQRREAEQAVAEERLRIARELHDVVAHAMSVVAVQSGVAAHVIEQRPDEAKHMLQNINTTSREALDEMRRMLGVLRSDGDDPAALAPAPTLGDLSSLIATVRGTGVEVRLRVEGEAAELAPGLDLTAFRIVQEALTNVVKHAGKASVEVLVRYEPDGVCVQVTDDGRGAASAADVHPPGDGHGLIGMRERVDLYGGSLDAGPRAGGGFRIAATLPYPTVAAR
jgi:signal transduction histidine kinase